MPIQSSLFDDLPSRLKPVAKLLAEGKDNSTIATELSYTKHTVEVYVSQIKEHVGARDRVDLVLGARRWRDLA